MADPHDFSGATEGIDDVAAAWYARRDVGFTPREEIEFERWLAADPRHRAVWREYETALAPCDTLRATGTGEWAAAKLTARARQRRWRALAGFGTGLAAAALVLIYVGPREIKRASADAAPAALLVSKPERRLLSDGSVVELNFGAEIEVVYGTARRGVRLLRGEAHFSVEKNAARPFIVTVQGVEVRAVGTSFAVQAKVGAVDVLVTEGRVAVARVSAAPVFADAGSRVTVLVTAAEPNVEVFTGAEIERRLGWRGPRLELNGNQLSDAVAAFNRENRLQLQIADRTLARMQMSGMFRADNPEGFAQMLEANYDMQIERAGEVLILRPATPDGKKIRN